MPLHPTLLANARAIVFDAYGTLFDVHSAVGRHAAAVGPEAQRLSEIWRAKHLEYTWVLSLAGRSESFWTLAERALDHALQRVPSVDPGVKERLLSAYRTLDAYPEVPAALAAVRAAGKGTAILSNGDPDMLGEAVTSAGIGDLLDAVLSVAAVGVFKTDRRAYGLALDEFGPEPTGIVFVSSNRWDVAGAAAFGFVPVWVNRTGQPDEYPDLPPLAVVRDLSELI
jgi:2-haloacid dehalogenase